jgi:hypothetical protein
LTTTDYRRALEAAIKEYEGLKAQRDAVETRLAQLRQIISTLSQLCDLPAAPEAPPELGLTAAVRSVLRASMAGLTPVDVRDRLGSFGIDPAAYSNPLASIHVVLKRLTAAGELWSYRTPDGKQTYVWKRAAVPYAVHDPEQARTIVTGGLMWPGATDVLLKPLRDKKKPKKEK